jgi:hypothetical protein
MGASWPVLLFPRILHDQAVQASILGHAGHHLVKGAASLAASGPGEKDQIAGYLFYARPGLYGFISTRHGLQQMKPDNTAAGHDVYPARQQLTQVQFMAIGAIHVGK